MTAAEVARATVKEWDNAIAANAPREVLAEIGNALRNFVNRAPERNPDNG